MLLSMSVVGYVYALQRVEYSIMAIGCILIMLLYFYVSLVCSVYSGEIFPTTARLRGVGFANAFSRIAGIVTPLVISVVLSRYGSEAVFIVVSVLLTLIALVIAVFGVETRQKTLEEINENVLSRGA